MSETKMNIEMYDQMVENLVKRGDDILMTLTPEKVDLWHMGTGVAGEAGELIDAIKKYVVYNTSLDHANVVEELGDLEFYMNIIRFSIDVTREEVLSQNMLKLVGPNGRYADGRYSDHAAQERADKQ